MFTFFVFWAVQQCLQIFSHLALDQLVDSQLLSVRKLKISFLTADGFVSGVEFVLFAFQIQGRVGELHLLLHFLEDEFGSFRSHEVRDNSSVAGIKIQMFGLRGFDLDELTVLFVISVRQQIRILSRASYQVFRKTI